MGDRYDKSKIEGFGQKQGAPYLGGTGMKITVIYNNSAIKFYEKNGFKKVTEIRNYYNINGNHYDSGVYLRIFTRKEKDDFRDKNSNILSKIINTVIIMPLNLVYKIIIFILFFQCFRSKIKYE